MPARDDIKKILLIGSGPIVIFFFFFFFFGQACEFDYSGTQGAKALRELGYEVVLVNSNPATIMTDPGLVRRTYIEPLDVAHLTAIIERERPDAILPTLGGQTALNLALELHERGVLKARSQADWRPSRCHPQGRGSRCCSRTRWTKVGLGSARRWLREDTRRGPRGSPR